MDNLDLAPASGLAPEDRAAAVPRASFPVAGEALAGPGEIPAEEDFDPDADYDRWVADIEAGRCRIPEEWELEGPAVSISLGDATDLDPALLAAMCGPDGLGGTALSPCSARTRRPTCFAPAPSCPR